MRKIYVLFICCLIAFSPALATEGEEEKKEAVSFEIMVLDAETEDPIPAAKIKINQKEAEAYTDFDGHAKFSELVQGNYDIEISFISYEKQHLKAFYLDKSSNKLIVKLKP